MKPHDVNTVLFTSEQIHRRVDKLAVEIANHLGRKEFAMVGVLRGSFIFLADLVRALHRYDVHPLIDFMTLESYGSGTISSGQVRVTKDIGMDVRGVEVLVVDDILDSGRTLSYARKHLLDLGAASVRICTLLDKPARRVVPMAADFKGFTVDDVFVVGYGLDYDNRYRELPYVAKVTFPEPE